MSFGNGDIWSYAEQKVENKNIPTRMLHSSSMQPVRRTFASTGGAKSTAGRMAKVVLKSGIDLIPVLPIPVVSFLIPPIKDELKNQVDNLAGAIKNRYQDREGPKQRLGLTEKAKFQLKDVSVGDLDGKRFKIQAAYDDLLRYSNGAWKSDRQSAVTGGKVCDANVIFATKVAQVERRLDILDERVRALKAVLETATEWSNSVRSSISETKKNANRVFFEATQGAVMGNQEAGGASLAAKSFAGEQVLNLHQNCGDFCLFRGARKTVTSSGFNALGTFINNQALPTAAVSGAWSGAYGAIRKNVVK